MHFFKEPNHIANPGFIRLELKKAFYSGQKGYKSKQRQQSMVRQRAADNHERQRKNIPRNILTRRNSTSTCNYLQSKEDSEPYFKHKGKCDNGCQSDDPRQERTEQGPQQRIVFSVASKKQLKHFRRTQSCL